MGSVTKPYTCAAVMQQYERGKLDIDAPIARCLPEPNKHQPSQPRCVPNTAHLHRIFHCPLPLRAARSAPGPPPSALGLLTAPPQTYVRILDYALSLPSSTWRGRQWH